MSLRQFSILTDGINFSVMIDGVTIDASRVMVDVRAGEVGKMFLEMNGNAQVEGEGIVHVYKDLDQSEVVLEWLTAVDASAIEQSVLTEFDDPDMTTGQAFVAAMKKAAGGDG